MDREREIERIGAWIESNRMPTYEVRVGREIVQSVSVDDDAKGIASQLVDIVDDDFDAERRRRQYRIHGIAEDGQQYVCPLTLYRRPEGMASDQLVGALAKQVSELHATLLRRDDAVFSRSLRTIELLSDGLHKSLAELDRGRSRQEEIYTRLEALRTEQLERDLVKERHEKHVELLERGVDTALPLGMAIAGKLLTGPAKNELQGPTLVQIAKSMQEGQLDAIKMILGPELGDEVEKFLLSTAIEGRGDIDRFKALVGRIQHDKLIQVVSVLNMGQQAAIRELITL